jgi:hypothetical protein
MERARGGKGLSRRNSPAEIHVFLKHETDEAGQQFRRPHDQDKGEDVFQRNTDRSPLQFGAKCGLAERQGRFEQADTTQHADRPGHNHHPDQDSVGVPSRSSRWCRESLI